MRDSTKVRLWRATMRLWLYNSAIVTRDSTIVRSWSATMRFWLYNRTIVTHDSAIVTIRWWQYGVGKYDCCLVPIILYTGNWQRSDRGSNSILDGLSTSCGHTSQSFNRSVTVVLLDWPLDYHTSCLRSCSTRWP